MKEYGSDQEAFLFSDLVKVEKILSCYPDKQSAILPLLHLAQDQVGYLTREAVEAVADIVGIHPAQMMDSISFYTMFYIEPTGKYLIQVCQTLSCSLNGADELVDHVTKKLKILPGETTDDGKFTLLKVECLGSCGTAPVVQINRDYYEGLTVEEFDQVLDSLP